jgi:hypothetical protein
MHDGHDNDPPQMVKERRGKELLLRTATLSSACPSVSVGASERNGFGGEIPAMGIGDFL